MMSDRGRMARLAVCSERSGYVLDACSEELAKYRREVRSELIGESATYREALDAVFAEFERRRLRSLHMNSDRDRRALRIDQKKERRAQIEAELGARQRALPDKRYGVIYADPPW
jgi:16S rRNA G966 N2-methylase RsmD